MFVDFERKNGIGRRKGGRGRGKDRSTCSKSI